MAPKIHRNFVPGAAVMGLRDWISGQFIDIIEWTEPSQNEILAYRFPRHNNEIKNGAKLIVREGQAVVFVKEGQHADVMYPGMYTLDTNNLPILSTILGWKYGFESPFKCEVYFVATRQWTDQKWGTQNPVLMRDPEFGPIRLRAFGTYAFKISDPTTFLREIVSTDPSFEAFEISAQFRNAIVSRFVDAVGNLKMPILDLVGNYDRLSKLALQQIKPDLAAMGVELTQFYVESVSLPPEVEAALDKRSQMGILGNLDQYTKFQSAEAIRDAAQNPGGMAGMGVGIGAGAALGQQMGAAMAGAAGAPGAVSAPPPLPAPVTYHVAVNGVPSGPFGVDHVKGLVAEGKLTRATLVWKTGLPGWVAADTLPEMQPLLAAVPPPLPS
jgi:membrane protease subunit (stomatin/prohibitin family)